MCRLRQITNFHILTEEETNEMVNRLLLALVMVSAALRERIRILESLILTWLFEPSATITLAAELGTPSILA